VGGGTERRGRVDMGASRPPEPTASVRDSRETLDRAERALARGRLRDGIEVLERYLSAGSDSAAVRTVLGLTYARTRRVERAIHHLERAVGLEPTAFEPRLALAEIYQRLGLVEDGRLHLKQAMTLATSAHERSQARRLLRQTGPG